MHSPLLRTNVSPVMHLGGILHELKKALTLPDDASHVWLDWLGS